MRIDLLLRPSAHSFLASRRRLTFSNGVSIPTHARVSLGLGLMLVAGSTLAGPLAAAPTLGGDENGPKVQILRPGYQDILKGDTRILVGVNATKFNPATVQLFVDGKDASSGPIKLTAFASSSFNWNTRLFSDGQHRLTVVVTDTQGFRGWADVTIFINNNNIVDTAPPTLDWKNIEPFQQLSGTTQVTLDAKDNFGVKYLIVSLASAKDPKKKLRQWFLNEPPYTFNFDTTKVDDEIYVLETKAYDAKDQEGEARPLTIGVSNNAINATTIGDMLGGLKEMDRIKNGGVSIPTVPPAKIPGVPPVNAGGSTNGMSGSGTPGIKTPPVKTPNTTNHSTDTGPRNPQQGTGATTQQLGKGTDNGDLFAGSFTHDTTEVIQTPGPDAVIKNSPVGLLSAAFNKPKEGARSTSIELPKVSVAGQSRNVRISQPLGELREFMAPAQLSSGNAAPGAPGSIINSDAIAQYSINPSTQPRTEIARLAVPEGEERLVGSPVLSEKTTDDALASALNLSLHQGEINAGNNTVGNFIGAARPASPLLAERPVPAVQEPAHLSSGFASAQAALSPSLAPSSIGTSEATRSVKATAPDMPMRIASVPAAIPQNASAPELSPSSPATEGVRSNRNNSFAGSPLSKPNISNTRPSTKPRFGMVQPMGRTPEEHAVTGDNQRAAITASPLEVSAQNSIPAFHKAERETTLRAIAARYGVPVELVATANGWKADMRVVKGMTVKLPQPLQLSYNGVPVAGDVPSMLAGDTAVAAFRFMFQQAGGTMEWDGKHQQVIARKGKSQIVVKIGSNVARVNNKDVMMELAAFLFEGRTMVPLRFFEEGLNAEVEWDPQTGRIVMAMAS